MWPPMWPFFDIFYFKIGFYGSKNLILSSAIHNSNVIVKITAVNGAVVIWVRLRRLFLFRFPLPLPISSSSALLQTEVRSDSAHQKIDRLNLLYRRCAAAGARRGGDVGALEAEKDRLRTDKERLEEERKRMRAVLARCSC